jgi:peptidoglycan/xylan/chitin deacetylase (PgdA/CDA1 family)
MYHRVTELDRDPWQLCVSPKHFDEHMKVLKKYGNLAQMQEMGRTLRSWSLGHKQIVVTFDDGYADNFYNAKPILERYKIPATFFVVTGAIDKNEEFWWDELERIILHSPILPEQFKITIHKNDYFWPLKPSVSKEIHNYAQSAHSIPENNTVLAYDQLYYVLWNILSRLSFEKRKTVLQEIASWAGQTMTVRTSHKIMTKEELLNLARVPLFEIGAHTQHHPTLSYLNIDEQRQEIEESKKFLEATLGRPIHSFSCPHGVYTADTVKLLRELGFKASCICVAKQVVRKGDPLLLPRFMVFDWDGQTFEQKLNEWLGNLNR